MTNANTLADRVEGAEGPSYALELEIHQAVNPGSKAGHFPAYTASLDAAMTLVPDADDICWTLGSGPWVGPFARIWTCDPNREEPFDIQTSAASPALALVAAALKARTAAKDR